MRILIAPDSFKGSLRSPEVARAMAAGVRAALPDAEVICLPVGDGGEGTLDALVAATGGTFETVSVSGPLGAEVPARLGLLGDGQTVFVEMAEASGLSRLGFAARDPLRASTTGTGQLLAAAFATGRRRVLMGLGGSATNDGGAGALAALGARLLDRSGQPLDPGGGALSELASVDLAPIRALPERELILACDVTNPLCGDRGASAIYGPQKGASPGDVGRLDAALAHYADLMAQAVGRDLRDTPGAGAAGGLAFGLMAALGARVERGVDLVLAAVRFGEHLARADLVLTGEGKIDRQTLDFGKTLAGIGQRAARAGVAVLVLAGALGDDLGDYRQAGLCAVASIVPRPMTVEEAMAQAGPLIERAAKRMLELTLVLRR